MTQWIDDQGATLERFYEKKGLWVCERLPPQLTKVIDKWEIEAEPGDTVLSLLRKWLAGCHIMPMPRGSQKLQAKFFVILHDAGRVALIVREAHVLKGNVIDRMRLLAEAGALVVLQGDVSSIDMATRKFPSFYQRASYCVEVTRLFPTSVNPGPA